MDEQKTAPETQKQQPAPAEQPANNQAMDVVAPPSAAQPAPEASSPQGVTEAPADQTPAELPQEAGLTHEAPAQHHEQHHKEHHTGSNSAIIATVVIVIALATLATYAFITTQSSGL